MNTQAQTFQYSKIYEAAKSVDPEILANWLLVVAIDLLPAERAERLANDIGHGAHMKARVSAT